MYDLWSEVSQDVDAERRTRSLEMAKAASQGAWEFVSLAGSSGEYEDRLALALPQIEAQASANGVDPGDLVSLFNERFALLAEARNDDDSDDTDSDDDGDQDSDKDSDDSSDDDSDDSDDDSGDGSDDVDDQTDPDGDGDTDNADNSGKGKDLDPDQDEDVAQGKAQGISPWASRRYATLAARIAAGEDPLAWGGTPFGRSSARKHAVDGAGPVSDVNTPQPEAGGGMSPGLDGGLAETSKPRQMPSGGDPTMAPGMGMDGIGGSDFDPALNGGDIQQNADSIPPDDDARTAKIRYIAKEVAKYNPTLSADQCRKVASRVFNQYLRKHAEDMNPLLFGDRGTVGDGPATNRAKGFSPSDLNQKKDDDNDDNGMVPGLLTRVPGLPAAGEAGEMAGAARVLPLLAL